MNRHRGSLLMAGLTILVLACGPARQPSPASARVFDVVAGTWGWVEGTRTCTSDPHMLSFSPDRTSMFYRYPQAADSAGARDVRYEVRGHGRDFIRMFMVGETRTDSTGALVEWDLVLVSDDLYVWRRSDWPKGASTRPIERCSRSSRT
jgi:hypothetical protein